MTDKCVVIGSGGHARSVLSILLKTHKDLSCIVVGTPDEKLCGKNVMGHFFVSHDESDLPALVKTAKYFVLGMGYIGDGKTRKKKFEQLCDMGFEPLTVIAPSVVFGFGVRVGRGAQLLEFVYAGPRVDIGEGCLINTGARLDHDCYLGKFVNVSTGVILNGDVSVSDCSFLGSSSVVLQGVTIARSAFIKAGQLVLKSTKADS